MTDRDSQQSPKQPSSHDEAHPAQRQLARTGMPPGYAAATTSSKKTIHAAAIGRTDSLCYRPMRYYLPGGPDTITCGTCAARISEIAAGPPPITLDELAADWFIV